MHFSEESARKKSRYRQGIGHCSVMILWPDLQNIIMAVRHCTEKAPSGPLLQGSPCAVAHTFCSARIFCSADIIKNLKYQIMELKFQLAGRQIIIVSIWFSSVKMRIF